MNKSDVIMIILLVSLVITVVIPGVRPFDTCGDGVCGMSETSVSCPSDCPRASRLECNVRDGMCNKQCPYDPDCAHRSIFHPAALEGGGFNPVVTLVKAFFAFASLALIAFLVYRGVKRMRKGESASPGVPGEEQVYYPTNNRWR